MAVTHSTAARNLIADDVTALLDVGGAGTLEFQTSGSVKVAACTFSATAFGNASTGVCTAAAITSDTNAVGGSVTKAVLKNNAGTAVINCACGTSGSDINMST